MYSVATAPCLVSNQIIHSSGGRRRRRNHPFLFLFLFCFPLLPIEAIIISQGEGSGRRRRRRKEEGRRRSVPKWSDIVISRGRIPRKRRRRKRIESDQLSPTNQEFFFLGTLRQSLAREEERRKNGICSVLSLVLAWPPLTHCTSHQEEEEEGNPEKKVG